MNSGRRFLQFLRSLLPIKIQIFLEYIIKCKRVPNLRNPKRYTEKLQVYKLKYKNPILPSLVDKVKVREYIKEKGLEQILNEQYGIFDKVEDINFNLLPDKFVIKLNTGSGYNIIVEDKSTINLDEIKEKLKKWLSINPKRFGSEWVYKKVKPKLIIEKFIERDNNNDIPDYKFFAFNGEVDYLYTMVDFVDNHSEGKLGFFDTQFNKTEYYRKEYKKIDREIKKPKNFEKMLEYAKILSKEFPHVRVDFFNIEGKIYFGELTFYTNGGYINFIPDEFDFILGEKFNLNFN